MSINSLFKLPLEVTHVVLGGHAVIDQDGLNITSHDQAQGFALSYGFDLSLPHQRSQVVKTFEDALAFLEASILKGTDLKIPVEIYETQDPLELLLWASANPRNKLAEWSCAVLRVMHSLFYIDNNYFIRFMKEIQHQIFERYDQYIVKKQDGEWLLKGDYEIPLVDVARKENKNRESMLLKMLHKTENVAEIIYDNIGMRFVAEDLLDVLLTLRFLIDHNIIQAAHIKPSRTRNLMIDITLLEDWVGLLPDNFSIKTLSSAERQEICEKLAQRIGRPSINPYSSRDYSALQFTVNTLVRLPGPAVYALERIQQDFRERGQSDISDHLHIPELIQAQGEMTFFFAHEVQIMETSGFANSQLGPASHSEYKRRQREVVRKRLLRGLLP